MYIVALYLDLHTYFWYHIVRGKKNPMPKGMYGHGGITEFNCRPHFMYILTYLCANYIELSSLTYRLLFFCR